MARGPIAFHGRVKGGPARGGTGRQLRFFTDDTFTVPKTLFRRETGAGLQPVVMTPNAGVARALAADRLAADTFVTVPIGQTGFYNVGDLVPIWNAVQGTVERIITAITPATGRLDLDAALGVAFTVANGTQVNATDMEGHVYGWADDGTHTWMRVTELGSGRLLTAVKVTSAAPATSLAVQEEGVAVNSRATINFRGAGILATDDAPNARINVDVDAKVANVQVFTASGIWTKPTGAKLVEVLVIGPGGGGGGGVGGAAGSLRWGGGGGGGGALVRRILDPSALGATEAVTIGAGGTGGASGTAGTAGGSSSFGSHVTAYGGGPGAGAYPSGGGGGGGSGSGGGSGVGGAGSGGSPRTGAPTVAPTGDRAGGSGAQGGLPESTSSPPDVGNAEFGGGGGGGHMSSGVGNAGGSSIHGGAGGGGGGLVNASDVALASGAGGTINAYTAGGGGAAGSPGVAGTSRSGTGKCGDGGGAGNGNGAGVGFAGGAGGVPGGGGGAGGGGLTTGGAGAAGGRGEVIVVTYF